MELITTDTPAKAAGEAITALIQEHNGDTLCLLSGGSALAVIEHINQLQLTTSSEPVLATSSVAAEPPQRQSVVPSHECRTIFMMGDERGSRESDINNFLQLEARYQDHWVTKNCLRTVPEEDEQLEAFANRISAQLDKALAELRDPQVIHLMGMGADGHTAGIFPLEEDQFHTCYERDPSIVEVSLKGLKIDSRASVTPGWILQQVDHVIGYAAGESKYAMLESLVRDTKALHERPVELWKLKSGSRVYTDQHID